MAEEEVAEIRNRLKEHEERISLLEELLQTKPEKIKKKVSIREFILSKNPEDEIQKTLTIGCYLEKHEGLTSFNVKDLENGFRRAKEKIPGNINYKVIRNIQKGYMMEAKNRKDDLKAWFLTNLGEKYVGNNFK